MTDAEPAHPLRSRLRELYFGTSAKALRFQAALLFLDVLVIGFFIFDSFVKDTPYFYWIDYAIAAFLAFDMLAKLYALGSVQRWMRYPTTWIDLIVLATMLVPAIQPLGFLRILRLWTVAHRERTWNVLGGGRWDDTYIEDLTKAIVNLIVFIFMASGFAYAFFAGQHTKLNTFIDAMYFAITSLTTTGYGDITLDTQWGRVFKIVLMLSGITLFFGVAQKAFAPHKRRIRCAQCSLDRHEPDADYCRACGTRLEAPGQADA
ncbi:MAG: ion transporter [Hyphomonadaceae bacterium]